MTAPISPTGPTTARYTTMRDSTREQNPSRFVIAIDGRAVGFSEFVDTDSQRIFFHTEIADEFGGRGLAGTLTRQALEQTRADGLRIVPVCPYVARFVAKNDEFADIVDAATPDSIAAIEAVKRAD